MLPPLTDIGPRECSSIIKKHISLTYWATDWNMLCVDPSKSDIFSTEVSKIKSKVRDSFSCIFLISVFSLTWEVGFGVKLRYISMPLHNTCAVMTGNCYVSLQAVIERWQYSNISTDGHTFGFHDESSHLNMSVKKLSLLPHVQPLFLPGLLISEFYTE